MEIQHVSVQLSISLFTELGVSSLQNILRRDDGFVHLYGLSSELGLPGGLC